MLVIKSNTASGNLALPILNRDQLIDNGNDGVRWDFDLAFPYSYAGGTPANGSIVKNIVDDSADGAVVLRNNESLTYAGGGFDFSALTKRNSYLQGPPDPIASIWGTGVENQYWLICLYMKLPLIGDWNTSAGITPMFNTCVDTGTYVNQPNLCTISQLSSGRIDFRRQLALNSISNLTITPSAGQYGGFAQIAVWRNAGGFFARLKTPTDTIITSTAAGANNSADFSETTPKYGPSGTFFSDTISANPGQENHIRYRLYRSFIENLRLSLRDAMTVLDADYARVINRAVFS